MLWRFTVVVSVEGNDVVEVHCGGVGGGISAENNLVFAPVELVEKGSGIGIG